MKFLLVLMVFGPGAVSVTTIGEFDTPEACAQIGAQLAQQAIETANKIPASGWSVPGTKEWHAHAVCQPLVLPTPKKTIAGKKTA